MTTQDASATRSGSVLGPALVFGFGAAVALWVAWFATHVPWVTLKEPVKAGVLLAIWLVIMGVGGRAVGASRGWKVGAIAGLTSAVVSLLLLGANIVPKEGANAPSVPLIVVGFLALGVVVGIAGGAIGSALNPHARDGSCSWVPAFGLVAALGAAPLLFVGGLVTSQNVGMAVPDWPQTFGMNMFLFPLGNANEGVFLEHSHRLFGTLVGVTTLVLMIWTIRAESRRWVKLMAVGVFAAVVIQGVLGGGRVLGNSVPAAIVHGVFAQLIFAGLVALTVMLYATPERLSAAEPFDKDRKIKAFATAAMHSTILQIILGAVYRHMRGESGALHALYAHIGFSFVVLIMGVLGGLLAASIPASASGLSHLLRRFGQGMVVVVIVQFLLGWAAFGMGGSGRIPDHVYQALLRTTHQANGALFLGLATGAAVLSKMLYRRFHPKQPA